jgi:hypothetical protein
VNMSLRTLPELTRNSLLLSSMQACVSVSGYDAFNVAFSNFVQVFRKTFFKT